MSLTNVEDANPTAEAESFNESPPTRRILPFLPPEPFRTLQDNSANVQMTTQSRPTTLIPPEHHTQEVLSSAIVLPAPNSLSLPDYYIPQQEKKHLLRKFSAPFLNRQQPLSLLARSPSFDELALVRRSSERPLTIRSELRSSANIIKFLDDKLKCPMCKNPFSDPRVLDCLHSFCFQCLCNESDGRHGRNRENSEYELSCEFFVLTELHNGAQTFENIF